MSGLKDMATALTKNLDAVTEAIQGMSVPANGMKYIVKSCYLSSDMMICVNVEIHNGSIFWGDSLTLAGLLTLVRDPIKVA